MKWQERFLLSRDAGEEYARSMATSYTHGDLITCRVLGRYRVTGEACNEDIMPCLILDGFWEAWLTRMLLGYVKPGYVCVDIGANVGYYTLLMAELVGSIGKVHAYEPEPVSFDLLCHNVIANGFNSRVTVKEKACGATSGEGILHSSRRISGGSTIGVSLPVEYDQRQITVPIVRLDSEIPGRVNIIKCDAEGMDAEVLMGAEDHFRRNPALVMLLEYDPAHQEKMRPALEYARSQLNVHPWSINSDGEVSRVVIADILRGPFTNFVLAR